MNIYCAWGESDYCRIDPEVGIFVPEKIGRASCYVGFPSQVGAGCVSELGMQKVQTWAYLADHNLYAPIYYRAHRVLAGRDIDQSVLLIRATNVILASVLLLGALLTGTPAVRRGLALAWGTALVPVGVFFIASVNPSAWLIASVGTYWAFLASLLDSREKSLARRVGMLTGLAASLVMAVGSRTDSLIYIVVISVAILIWRYRSLRGLMSVRRLFTAGAIVVVALAVALSNFFSRYPVELSQFSFPGAHTGTDQPAMITKIAVEFPAFFLGLLGAQGPQSGLATGGLNRFVEGYTSSGFYYGIGWMDFNLPSLVGILSGLAAFALIFTAIRHYPRTQGLAVVFLVIAIVGQILLMRGWVAFQNTSHIQPRYIFPIFLASLGIALAVRTGPQPLLRKTQGGLLVVMLAISGSLAWLATAARYAVGPNATYTNFGQTPEWWWNIGPGRLGWFLVAAVLTGLWVYFTVWIWGTGVDTQLRERSQARKNRARATEST